MKKDFIIATKKISALGSFAGKSNTFSAEEIADLKKQPFTKTIGAFTPSQFKVSAGLGMKEAGIHLSTDMFFESVPDGEASRQELAFYLRFYNLRFTI